MDGCAVAKRHANFGDLIDRVDLPGGPHDVAFALVFDVTGANAAVVFLQRFDHIAKGQAIADELHRIRLHVKLLDVTADGIDTRQTLHPFELRADDPVLHRSQIRGTLHIGLQFLPFGRQVTAVALPAGFTIDGL